MTQDTLMSDRGCAANLPQKSPTEIDAELSELGYERAKLIARAENSRTAARHARGGRYPDVASAVRLETEAAECIPLIEAVTKRIAPLNEEYRRRGGWSRAYLVQNTGGHVHSSMNCSTCYPSTQYAWLTDYSGKSEDEIVYAAGELACTVCYPTAPVEVLKRVGEIRRPADTEREQRAAAKATKAAQKAADAVTDPANGKVLFKTERAAANAIAAALGDLLWYGPTHPSAAKWSTTVEAAVDALAAKLALNKDDLMSEYRTKAAKKFGSTARKVLRDLTARGGDIVVEDLVPGIRMWVEENGIPA
jgi:hypothetical protein